MKITILAEKPIVGEAIANALDLKTQKNGYIYGVNEGNEYSVTWTSGHLLELTCEEEKVEWREENLPIIPEQFYLRPRTRQDKQNRTVPDENAVQQLEVIRKLFEGCDEIIAATDAGREGQLIFEYTYSYIGCIKPIKRFWCSSLTRQAVKKALNNLYDNRLFVNLYNSAACRAEMDWMIGVNGTRALTVTGGNQQLLSMGRLQLTMLKMICENYISNITFKAGEYYTIRTILKKGLRTFKVRTKNRYDSIEEVLMVKEVADRKRALKIVENRIWEEEIKPPTLYNLPKLQQEMSSMFGLTAIDTLNALQSLYEKRYMSYPRTESRYISYDVYETLPAILDNLAATGRYTRQINSLHGHILNEATVDELKITDHHALIVTEDVPNWETLSDNEKKIYNAVVFRMTEALGQPCKMKYQTILCEDEEGNQYSCSGKIVLEAGWKDIVSDEEKAREAEKESPDEEKHTTNLPDMEENEELKIVKSEIVTGTTRPPHLMTDGSLINRMQNAAKDTDDKEIQRILKDVGIGTAATRAAEIETLITRGYVIRDENNHMVPTKKGVGVYNALKDKDFARVELTGNLELALEQVAKGKVNPMVVRSQGVEYTRHVVSEIFNKETTTKIKTAMHLAKSCCPFCGKTMSNFTKFLACANCGFRAYRTIAGKMIDEFTMDELFENKETELIKGFRGPGGKLFDDRLVLTPYKKIVFKEHRDYNPDAPRKPYPGKQNKENEPKKK